MRMIPKDVLSRIKSTRRTVSEELKRLEHMEGAEARAAALKRIDTTIIQLDLHALNWQISRLDDEEFGNLGPPVASWRILFFAHALNQVRNLAQGARVIGTRADIEPVEVCTNLLVIAGETQLVLTAVFDEQSHPTHQAALTRELLNKGLLGRWTIASTFTKEGHTFVTVKNPRTEFDIQLEEAYVAIEYASDEGANKRWTTKAAAPAVCREIADRLDREAAVLKRRAERAEESVKQLRSLAATYEPTQS